ncbi:MAG: hypothetical protein ACRBK7_29180 [Acidimicrobiales bacterium]
MTEGAEPTMDLQDLLHPDEQRRFRRLCIATSAEDLRQLALVIEMHLDHIRENAGAATDVETAEMIGESLTKLLASDIEFDDDARAQVRGAVEYFLLTDDAAGDMDDVLGFDDDARVVNTVLERIGHPEFSVRLPS